MGLLLLPVLTRYFQPKDYGIISLISVLSVLTSSVYALGTGNSLGLCYHEAEGAEERARVIWTTSALLLANSLVLTLAGCLLSRPLSAAMLGSADFAYPICLSLATLAVNTVTMPFLAHLQLEERAKTYVGLSLVSSTLTLLLTIYLVVYRGRGIEGMFEAGLGGALVLFVIVIAAVWPRLRPALNFKWVGPLVKIGFPSVFGIGAFFLIDWSDRVMIERFVGLDEVGRYSIGYSFGMVISLAVAAFGSAWPPYFISFLHKREEAAVLFGQIFKYYVIAFGSLTLLFFLMARPVVTVMTAPPYHSAFMVVGLVALAYMLKGCYLIMLPALVYEKKLYLQTVIEWAAAAINVGLNFILIPLFLKQGAAISTLIAYFCLPVLTYLVGRKYLPVQ
jgi:O-antigen/teichoic acid export membrane protein